jgi:penicillin-binding protein 2
VTWNHPFELARRGRTARLAILAVFGVLALAFFRIQVLLSERFELVSESNRLRQLTVPAPRGLIIDRDGVVLAENVPGYSVSLIAASEDSLRAALERLQPFVPTSRAERERIVERYGRAPSEPVLVRRDAPLALVSALEEGRVWNPEVVIQSDPRRRYPFGEVAAHLVGYVGEVTDEELRAGEIPKIRLGAEVGRDGLEQQYDVQLRGHDGARFVEQDALGRTVREGRAEAVLPPQPGTTVRTTVDIELQQYIHDQFPAGARGAVMALDPRNGEVLALYSSPSYDPNAFIRGIDPEAWEALVSSPDFPLFNRATQARYPPASPWKLAVAAMGLQRGVVHMGSHMPIPCRGGLPYYTRYFRCWKLAGHGDLTLAEAIQYSCDVYFYQLGLKLGVPALLADGGAMGFRDVSGIDLPNETRPQYPASTEYYNQRYGPRGWTSAVALNLSIGQGENAQTLANMVRFYAMLASPNGRAPEPRLVVGEQTETRSLGLTPEQLAGLRHALVFVLEAGTAAGARVANLAIAGKTGTAQNPQGADHGWFIGFAPAEEPTIVVGAIVEFAEHGSAIAPMVTRIISRYVLGESAPTFMSERLLMPEDSAPASIPILPDTSLLRPRDTTGAPPRPR